MGAQSRKQVGKMGRPGQQGSLGGVWTLSQEQPEAIEDSKQVSDTGRFALLQITSVVCNEWILGNQTTYGKTINTL